MSLQLYFICQYTGAHFAVGKHPIAVQIDGAAPLT